MPTTLITGSNRGIGLELVRQYAADGWEVIATARNPEDSPALVELAKKYKAKVKIHPLDVADEDSVEDLTDELEGRAIDLLVNNAGVYPREGNRIGELDFEAWRETFETNVFGVLRVTEALLDNVEQSQRKQIAAISSGMGSLGALADGMGSIDRWGTSYQYRTSKSALNMAMLILAKELAPRGISVAIISPGWVQTDMGGANAAITPEVSVAGIKKILEGGMEISGKFLGYDDANWAW